MKVLGERVLVRQTMVKKKTVIIVPGEQINPEQWDYTFNVTAIGDGCPKDTPLKIGDIPIFAKYADLSTMKVIEKTNEKMVTDIIVHFGDIAGIDDPEETLTSPMTLPSEEKVVK